MEDILNNSLQPLDKDKDIYSKKLIRPLNEAILALLSHPQLDFESEEYINEISGLLGQVNVAPMNGTKMICTTCKSINSPGYKLRRSAGKYLAYCVDEFGGCAAKEVLPKCGYSDHMGVECDNLAEFQITYGEDKLINKYACTLHTGILLRDSKNTVYPVK
jgi:hypothetical protein